MIEELESILLSAKEENLEGNLRPGRLFNLLSMTKQELGEGSWVGLYLFRDGILYLGPFQGTPACEKILPGKGVVGECFQKQIPVSVEDVVSYPNYICCDSSAVSEICLPLPNKAGVLDIDLPYSHRFNEEETRVLQQIGNELIRYL